MRSCDLYVLHKWSGKIHKIGTEKGDALWVLKDALQYENTEIGGGGTFVDDKNNGWVILNTDYGRFFDNEGIIDTRFEKEIQAYLDEQEVSE